MLDVSVPPHFSISPSRHRPDPDSSLSAFRISAFQRFSVSVFQHLSFQFLLSAFPISAFPQVPHDAHRTSSNLRFDLKNAREVKMLGRYNDAELARRLRRGKGQVRRQQIALIAP
jgi:hypothetical protein